MHLTEHQKTLLDGRLCWLCKADLFTIECTKHPHCQKFCADCYDLHFRNWTIPNKDLWKQIKRACKYCEKSFFPWHSGAYACAPCARAHCPRCGPGRSGFDFLCPKCHRAMDLEFAEKLKDPGFLARMFKINPRFEVPNVDNWWNGQLLEH